MDLDAPDDAVGAGRSRYLDLVVGLAEELDLVGEVEGLPSSGTLIASSACAGRLGRAAETMAASMKASRRTKRNRSPEDTVK
jgi:hypothetical protein